MLTLDQGLGLPRSVLAWDLPSYLGKGSWVITSPKWPYIGSLATLSSKNYFIFFLGGAEHLISLLV